MPGRGDTIPYNSNRMTNWWYFTGDWDAANKAGIGLYEPAICDFTLSKNSDEQLSGTLPGTGEVNVTCNGGCKWFASSNENWITLQSGSIGDGNGTVRYSVSTNNTGATRIGTIAIAGKVFTVTQTVQTCTVTIPSPTQNISANADSGTFTVNTQTGCDWSAVSNASWITLTTATRGTQPARGIHRHRQHRSSTTRYSHSQWTKFHS